MAGKVLYNMFEACEFDIRRALIEMPEEMNGVFSIPGKKYFDVFVGYLDSQIRKSKAATCDPDWPQEAKPRKADLVLNEC